MMEPTVEELLAECAALTKALTGLTRGGSEYFTRKGDRYTADIPACVSYVRDVREMLHRVAADARRELNAARRERDEANAIADLADELIFGGGLRNNGDALIVVERADKSDPHYRLCAALEKRRATPTPKEPDQ